MRFVCALVMMLALSATSHGQVFNLIDSDYRSETWGFTEIKNLDTDEVIKTFSARQTLPYPSGYGHGPGYHDNKLVEISDASGVQLVTVNTASQVQLFKNLLRSAYNYKINTKQSGQRLVTGKSAVRNEGQIFVKLNGTSHSSYLVKAQVVMSALNPNWRNPLYLLPGQASGTMTSMKTKQFAALSDGNYVSIEWDSANKIFRLIGQKTDQQGVLTTFNTPVAAPAANRRITFPSLVFYLEVDKDVTFSPYVQTNPVASDLDAYKTQGGEHVNGPTGGDGTYQEYRILEGGVHMVLTATGIDP